MHSQIAISKGRMVPWAARSVHIHQRQGAGVNATVYREWDNKLYFLEFLRNQSTKFWLRFLNNHDLTI